MPIGEEWYYSLSSRVTMICGSVFCCAGSFTSVHYIDSNNSCISGKVLQWMSVFLRSLHSKVVWAPLSGRDLSINALSFYPNQSEGFKPYALSPSIDNGPLLCCCGEDIRGHPAGLIRLFKVKNCVPDLPKNPVFTKGFLKWIFLSPTLKNRSKKGWFSQVFSPINFRFATQKRSLFWRPISG